LGDSHTTVIIPFDDRVIFISLFNCAKFSGRLSEIAQTLDAISGIQFLARGRGLGERWPLGTIRVKSRPGVCQGWFGSFMQFWHRLIGHMGDIPLLLFQKVRAARFATTVYLLDRYNIGLERMIRLVQTAQF